MEQRIAVDRSSCSGHGRCYGTAPDLFDCDEEGLPVIRRETVPEAGPLAEEARRAVDSCPERAISLEST